MKFLSKIEKVNAVDLNLAFKLQIEPDVENDNAVYCLEQKSRLLRRFILYRMSSFFLDQALQAREDGARLVLFLDKNLELAFLKDYEMYIKNTTKILANLLGLVLYRSELDLKTFTTVILGKTGSSVELKHKLKASMSRAKKVPNLQDFYNLLSKNNIHKIQDNLKGSTHLKLGLFVT